ncbi:hypothetical protein OIU84_018629 [Salix udensis]|uniref:Uncharacterized protein n=1 Tax=Salix udensis TaxID=889485 RepID=A0AAD6PIG9_9ROSI|nr:hypothetical protein OIU84_018629 [Salix udensis]
MGGSGSSCSFVFQGVARGNRNVVVCIAFAGWSPGKWSNVRNDNQQGSECSGHSD